MAPSRRTTVIQIIFWLILLALVSGEFFALIKPFVLPIVWAVTLAIIFHPTYRKLRDRTKGRESLAATLTVVLIFVVVLVPIIGVIAAMVNQGLAIYARVEAGEYNLEEIVQRVQTQLPMVQQFLTERGIDIAQVQTRLVEAAGQIGQRAVAYTTNALSNVAGLVVSFFVMLYLVYFFLKDGYRILGNLIEALPLGDEHEWKMLARFGATARATIKGSVIVGLVQGAIGGVAFWALGIDGPIFWGVIMAIASLIPTVGTALIWAPTALFLLSTGTVAKGLILIAIGGGVIGMVDNLLRPVLVGRDSGVPDWIVLLVSFGGIAAFGLSGLIIGPVVAALFLAVWKQFTEEFNVTEDLVAAVLTRAQEAGTVTLPEHLSTPELSDKDQNRVDNEKASVAMHIVIAQDAAESAARNATRADVAAQQAVESAQHSDPNGAGAAAKRADEAADEAATNATAAAGASATVQMSAEFIRQKIEGDVSEQAQIVVEAAASEAATNAENAQRSADVAQQAADAAQARNTPDGGPKQV